MIGYPRDENGHLVANVNEEANQGMPWENIIRHLRTRGWKDPKIDTHLRKMWEANQKQLREVVHTQSTPSSPAMVFDPSTGTWVVDPILEGMISGHTG